jgi:hypothetical protein
MASEGMSEMGTPGSKLWHHSGITTAATCGYKSHGHIANTQLEKGRLLKLKRKSVLMYIECIPGYMYIFYKGVYGHFDR